MRCHLFWTPLFNLKVLKKVWAICLYQDIRAWTPITSNIRRMPTQIRANIRYIQENHYNLWKIEFILNKANAYLCMLFVCCFMPQADFCLFVFLLSRTARKHRSERDDLFHYQLAVRLIPLNAYYSTQLFYCF